MSILDVAGARLYYETHGNGPLIILVPGAGGSADVFGVMAKHLSAHYTVAIYDRRGFSRSDLDGRQDYDRRLETDAEDVRRLIKHLSDDPAILFGGSSGGIVVLEVLVRHPEVVHTVVPFEPPAVRLLPDGEKWLDFFFDIYDIYCQSGIEPALKQFRQKAFTESDAWAMTRAKRDEYSIMNATYWFEHELRQYPAVEFDLEALRAYTDRTVLAIGRDSYGHPACEVNVELGRRLGREVVELPGGHVGYMAQPTEFTRELLQVLPR